MATPAIHVKNDIDEKISKFRNSLLKDYLKMGINLFTKKDETVEEYEAFDEWREEGPKLVKRVKLLSMATFVTQIRFRNFLVGNLKD